MLCPCTSNKPYQSCCQPLHEGVPPESAESLMRSRFSAYALGLADYIIITTHPASPQFSPNRFQWKKSIGDFSKNSHFMNLKILDAQERDEMAVVVFTAYLKQKERDLVFTERSYFQKRKGLWTYLHGEVREGEVEALIKKGDLKILPLAYYGEDVLRQKALPVVNINPEIKQLVQGMIETMDAWHGLGLAAPQVHQSLRIFVIRIPEDKHPGKSKVFINPELKDPSKKLSKQAEGCLSIPCVRGEVERPQEISVKYTTLEGEEVEERFFDLTAKAISHEFDHLEGILYIDRLPQDQQEKLAPYLKGLVARLFE